MPENHLKAPEQDALQRSGSKSCDFTEWDFSGIASLNPSYLEPV